ncbi:MAG: hypothetical protein LBT58_00345 [Endomicrobium sp.]|jgi:hypothetical protein|nr:hypothetical protein [Endomicrobium sp.]
MAIIRKFNRSTSGNADVFANTSGYILRLITDKHITNRPLDVKAVAKALNIGLEYIALLDSEVSGILRKEDKRTICLQK